MRIFLFFALQMILRVAFSILYIKDKNIRSQLIAYDIAGSVILLLIAFYPFIRQIVASAGTNL